jgi:hypothetical protein
MANEQQPPTYDYTELLTELVKAVPKRVTLDLLSKRVAQRLADMEPEALRGYLEGVLLQNLAAVFFEGPEDEDDVREATTMTDRKLNLTEREMIQAAAAAVDMCDEDTALFLLSALDDDEYEEEMGLAPYSRLDSIENKNIEIGPGLSWLRVTMDRAPYDPQWLRYCRLHRAQRIGPISWDFPVLPHEDTQSVLRIIEDETGYRPRFYQIMDQKGEPPRDVPGEPFSS